VTNSLPVTHLLLEVYTLPSAYLKKGVTPLAMEFPVDSQTAPFLVSNSTSLTWVPAAPSSRVRAAVRRNLSLQDFFKEIVVEVALVGKEAGWGNSHDHSLDGIRGCIEHVRSYDLPKVQLLCSLTDPILEDRDSWEGCEITRVHWLPDNTVVAVPSDRGFVGFVFQLQRNEIISVVHNASRGLGVAWG